ncbi:MAG: hypothetical protein K6C35_03750 [Eubacterium sp.]|nr:hypothetical protein [Eubacterium sp.]
MAKRILAWITLIVIGALIIAMIVSAITGNGYFLGFLFAAIAVPAVLYVAFWIRGLIEKYHQKDETTDESGEENVDKGSKN